MSRCRATEGPAPDRCLATMAAPSPTPAQAGMPTMAASFYNDTTIAPPPFCSYPNVSEIVFFCKLKGAYCGHISSADPYPKLCVPGNYCATAWEQAFCPKGHFCPLGASQPRLCSSLFAGVACRGKGQSYPNLFVLFLVIFLFFFPIVVLTYYADMRSRRLHLQRAMKQEASMREELQDKQTMLDAARHVRAAVAVTMASRFEDDLSRAHQRPIERFRRAVRQVISLTREARSRQARMQARQMPTQATAQQQPALGETMVRHLNRQVQRLTRFEEIHEPLSISFERLSMNVGETRILQNLSGAIYAKNTTALMGPSGAGKTSLMTLLRGRAHYGNITGSIAVNGKVVPSLSEYTEFMGFVPQEDVMYEELSVEENIFFACLLFSRKDAWGGRRGLVESRLLVNDVVSILGLHKVRNSVIGNSEVRGVSGGQRKRVNVGMELVKGPRILFLDEPTSGLDSSTSVALMETLSALASFGMTVAATIHQPRYEIFEKMDDIILLAPGGRMVYCGKTRRLEQYMNKVGYPCPAKVNVADFAMDVLCGLVKSSTGHVGADAVQDYLVWSWPSERQGFEAHSFDRATRRRTLRRYYQAPDLGGQSMWAKFRTQLAFVAYRQLLRFARSWRTVLVDLLSLYLVGGIVGLLFGPMTVGTAAFQSQIMVLELAYGFLTSSAALRTFGSDRVVYLREEASGMWILPYYLGKLVGVLPNLFLQPAAFMLSFYSLARPQQTSTQFYGALWCLSYVIYAVGNLIGVSVGSKSQNTATVCVMILFWCANGVTLKPSDLVKNFGGMGKFLYSISYFRFTSQALMVAEFQTFSQAVRYTYKKRYFRNFWLADSQLDQSWRTMLVYGSVVHMLTIVYLYMSFDEYESIRRMRAWVFAHLPAPVARALTRWSGRLHMWEKAFWRSLLKLQASLSAPFKTRKYAGRGGRSRGAALCCFAPSRIAHGPLIELADMHHEEEDQQLGRSVSPLIALAAPH